ncbi:hypothetical protein [Mycolicibacterium goodii]|uniref:hypothetical protein n=1 Tax=Mycolicibacterium goodii TaxID=134601 RepID=UPI0010553F59|nr:hypothetical protein [Mycolicibacterium goodii]
MRTLTGCEGAQNVADTPRFHRQARTLAVAGLPPAAQRQTSSNIIVYRFSMTDATKIRVHAEVVRTYVYNDSITTLILFAA